MILFREKKESINQKNVEKKKEQVKMTYLNTKNFI